MILPVIGYGNSILKRKSKEITDSYPGLKELIKNIENSSKKAIFILLIFIWDSNCF